MEVGKDVSLVQWFSKYGPQVSIIIIKWEDIKMQILSHRSTELETLGVGPSNLFFNELFGWFWYTKIWESQVQPKSNLSLIMLRTL